MPGPSWLQPVLQSLDMQFSTQTSTYQDGNSQLSSQTRIPGRLLFGGTVEHECPGSTGEDARALMWGAMCWGQATPAHVFTPTKLLQNMGVTEIVQSMFLYILRVDYVTHDQTSTGTCAAGSVQNWAVPVPAWHSCRCPRPTCCQIERPPLGWGLERRKPVQHRAHHWDLAQQPLQSTIQHWWEEPPGGWVTSRYHRTDGCGLTSSSSRSSFAFWSWSCASCIPFLTTSVMFSNS